MAYEGDTPKISAIDRSERHGHIGWVLLLAGILVGATLSLRFLGMDQVQPLILGLLAFFAMAGVFFLFAMSIGVVLLFERARLAQAWRNRSGPDAGIPPAPLS